jgi:outer membrane efflux protein
VNSNFRSNQAETVIAKRYLRSSYTPSWYAQLLIAAGRIQESLDQSKQALIYDPFALIINLGFAHRLYWARQYDLYLSGYLKQAQQSREISEFAFHQGAVSLIDLLDAERSYRNTELAYRQALANYAVALKQLQQAEGMSR